MRKTIRTLAAAVAVSFGAAWMLGSSAGAQSIFATPSDFSRPRGDSVKIGFLKSSVKSETRDLETTYAVGYSRIGGSGNGNLSLGVGFGSMSFREIPITTSTFRKEGSMQAIGLAYSVTPPRGVYGGVNAYYMTGEIRTLPRNTDPTDVEAKGFSVELGNKFRSGRGQYWAPNMKYNASRMDSPTESLHKEGEILLGIKNGRENYRGYANYTQMHLGRDFEDRDFVFGFAAGFESTPGNPTRFYIDVTYNIEFESDDNGSNRNELLTGAGVNFSW